MLDFKNKKIAVLGIGGVGGYLAGMLCNTFPQVTLVARSNRKTALEQHGLILHSEYHGEMLCHPLKICSASELEPQDFLFICVKNYSLESACREIAHAITDHTIIIPVMNGVDPGDRTRKYLKKGTVIDSLIYIVSFSNPDYSITQQGQFADIYLGIPDATPAQQEKIFAVSHLLREAGIDQHIAPDIQAAIWKKYILNCAYNVATAYYNEPIGSLRSHPVKSKEYEILVKEAFQVALAKGVHVSEKDVTSIIHKFYHDYADNATSSLMRDIAAGKTSELETFSGYLVQEAQKEGLSVPVSEKMYRKLLTKTQNNVV